MLKPSPREIGLCTDIKHSNATFILPGEKLYIVDHFLEVDAHLTARLFFLLA